MAVLQVLVLVLALCVIQEEVPPGSLGDLVALAVVELEDQAVVLVAADVEGNWIATH
jgi:hypothetical protein